MEYGENSLSVPGWLHHFSILRLGRAPLTGQPGSSGCGLPAIEAELTVELALRRDLARERLATNDGLSVNEWLKVTCYQLILVWHATGWDEDIEARIRTRFKRGTKRNDRDIFEEGLVGLFVKNPSAISVRDRGRLTEAMWHGFRHYIPPALLNAFNAQFPCRKTTKPDWREYLEPALDCWVIEQRTNSLLRECQLDTYRGRYPSRIEDLVRADTDLRTEANERRFASASNATPRSIDGDGWE